MRFTPRTELRKYKTSYLNPPKIEFAMIMITYPVVNGEGEKVSVTTWWTGDSAKAALRKWLARRSDIKRADVEVATVTEWKKPSRFEPIGERVEIHDESLAACG